MSSNEQEIGYRRNGKKQACEPCRKGKIACDHGTPHCGRCVRLKNTANCRYHPAPMTKTNGRLPRVSTGPKKHSSPAITGASMSLSPPEATQYHSTGVQTITPINDCQTKTKTDCGQSVYGDHYPRNSQTNWKQATFPRSTRYYGETSFKAMFSENETSMGELYLEDDTRKHPGSWILGEPLLGRQRPNTPVIRATHTVKALWNIPTRDTCFQLLDKFKSMHDSTLDHTMLNHCISALWRDFEPELTERTDAKLAIIADVLFDNEESPLPPSPDGAFEWLDTFTGSNIRFEMLGILFSFFGLAYLFLQDSDPLLNLPEVSDRDRKQIAYRMKECADVCLNMCDAAETVNFLVTALIFNVKVLESGTTGDESESVLGVSVPHIFHGADIPEAYKIRRLNGDMVTSAISSGLHRLPNYSTTKMSAASEYKRRLFSTVYCSDKTHSSLNCTPPLLTRRYCDIEPCLDLDPKAPYFSEDELRDAINSLDANGWNTTNTLHDTTLLRAKVHLSAMREDILELSLGASNTVSHEMISDLQLRSQNLFASFPSQLHYYASNKIPKKSTGVELYEQAYITLQALQNEFLLNRVAIARGFANGQGLLENAFEMLDIALMFWTRRDELMVYSGGFDWIITYYGIPSAGAICVQLLKQTSGQTPVRFSRSDAIQKLTLFIGFLEWIRPSHGNYKLATRLKQVIKRVLDHVLENRQIEDVGVPVEMEFERFETYDPMLLPYEDVQDLNWLNTIDWTQGSWMEFDLSGGTG